MRKIILLTPKSLMLVLKKGLFFGLFWVVPCGAESLNGMPVSVERGKVAAVSDGDTFKLKTSNREVWVKIAGIDAPDPGQKGAGNARTELVSMIQNQHVSIKTVGRDCKGRWVAEVFLQGRNIGSSMVAKGQAWVSGERVSDLGVYQLQSNAKSQRKGFWKQDNPIPPWEWREKNGVDPCAR